MVQHKRTTRTLHTDVLEDQYEEEKTETRPMAPIIEVIELEDEENVEPASKQTPKEEISKETETQSNFEEVTEPTPELHSQQPESIVQNKEKERIESELDTKKQDIVEEIYNQNQKEIPPPAGDENNTKPQILLWAILVIVAAITIGIGLLVFTNKPKESIIPITQAPTAAITETAVPTPIPTTELTRTDITIEVLNGGGVVGAAGKMKALLTDKGYDVKNVSNAKKYDYTMTEILVKSDKEQALKLLEEDLSENYTIGSSSATLDAESPYDAQVIVGKE